MRRFRHHGGVADDMTEALAAGVRLLPGDHEPVGAYGKSPSQWLDQLLGADLIQALAEKKD